MVVGFAAIGKTLPSKTKYIFVPPHLNNIIAPLLINNAVDTETSSGSSSTRDKLKV